MESSESLAVRGPGQGCKPEWDTVVGTELKGVKRLGLKDVWIAWMRARRTRSRRRVESGDGIVSAAWRPVSNFSLALTSRVVLGKLVHFPAPVSSSVRWER